MQLESSCSIGMRFMLIIEIVASTVFFYLGAFSWSDSWSIRKFIIFPSFFLSLISIHLLERAEIEVYETLSEPSHD